MARTPSIAKNALRRMLWGIVDPEPTWNEISELRGYFGEVCFYCDKSLPSLKDDFTLDHVVPSSQGGTNGISNRVPACRRCNSTERRDKPFEDFLHEKCVDEKTFGQKLFLALEWCASSFQPHHQLPPELATLVANEVAKLHSAIDTSVQTIRAESARLGWPKYSAKDIQTLAGIETPGGMRSTGNRRRR